MDPLNLHKQQLSSGDLKNLKFGWWEKTVEHI